MANAAVDKLKTFGLRQGEKVLVAVAAAVLLFGAYLLATKPTITLTPDELGKKAEQADSNLNRKQDPATIATAIDEAGIKDPGFVALVDAQESNALKPDEFRPRFDWVTPEPGAGLIRDQPEMIAPTELAAFPGRGGMLLFTLDDKGERIVDTSASASASGRRSGGSSPGGGAAAPSEEAKAREERAARERQRTLAGNATTKKEEEKAETKEDAPAATAGPYKEGLVGKRWVVVTAVLNSEELNKNWLLALKNPAVAYPQYKRVDAQRQIKQDDGTWSSWAAVDDDAKFRVLDNMTEGEPELIAAARRPEALVDPLPFLQAGYWSGVHVRRLVPEEILNPKTAPAAQAGRGGSRSMGTMGSMSAGAMSMPGGGEDGMSGAGSRPMSGGMNPAGGGGPDEQVVANTEPTLMIRALDFAVEPNTTYRYRLRLVVKNPNFDRTDVNPGVDTTAQELLSPWSDPTPAVTVRSDVSTYAQNSVPDQRRDDVVMFQVIRWDPASGFTVVKTDDAAPGQLIGENGNVLRPVSDGTGAKNETIDFNSRSTVLDTVGGRTRIPDIGLDRTTFEIPAVAMVVEPDGAVVVRNQARDIQDEVRNDMEAGYKQALEDSGKSRKKSRGAGRPGIPGGVGAG